MTGEAAQTALMHELVTQIASLRSAGKRVVVVHNIPVAAEFDPLFMLKRNWGGDAIIRSEGISRETWNAGLKYWTGDFAEVVRASGAELIDPAEFLCDARKCPAVDEHGEPRYRDGFHLRASFVRDRVTYLDELVKAGK